MYIHPYIKHDIKVSNVPVLSTAVEVVAQGPGSPYYSVSVD